MLNIFQTRGRGTEERAREAEDSLQWNEERRRKNAFLENGVSFVVE